MPSGVYVRDPEKTRSYTESEPGIETRQQYATARIQEFQRKNGRAVSFEILLYTFVLFGIQYDQGYRLRDMGAAA